MDYESYLLAEWNGFLDDPKRARAAIAAIANRQVQRVLDVGCGAGQELIPFAQSGAFCVGIDISPQVGHAPWRPEHGQVTFVQGAAETLPFQSASFDVLVCRVALAFMHNRRALREMARVLRPRGLLLLKLNAAPFYLRDLRRGLADLDVRRCLHAVHVLVGGVIYHALGSQIRTPFINATFQSEWMLRRELRRVGMRITMPMPDSGRVGPSFAIEKDDS
jgi:ubiquinone/menaquinone biosynthesis C-methylase UbiE